VQDEIGARNKNIFKDKCCTNSVNLFDLYIKNQEAIKCYYNFGKALKDRLNYHKILHPKQTAKMFVRDQTF